MFQHKRLVIRLEGYPALIVVQEKYEMDGTVRSVMLQKCSMLKLNFQENKWSGVY